MTTAHRTWLALLGVVAAALVYLQWNPPEREAGPGPAPEPDTAMRLTARFAVGTHELEKIAGKEGQAAELVGQLAGLELDARDRLRRAIVEAEVRGSKPALAVLEATKGEDQDRALLTRRYEGGLLTAAEQERLVESLRWFGKLSNSYGRPDDDPERKALLEGARRAATVMITFTAAALPALLAGFVLFVMFLVHATRGRIRMRFALHDEGSGDLVWLQTVVLALGAFLLVSLGLLSAAGVPPLAQLWLTALPLLWPLARKMKLREWTGGLGLGGGAGLFREIRAGVLGYIGGIPVILLGYWMMTRLSHVTGLTPEHPIQYDIEEGAPAWILIMSSVVWAPIVEELLFRGAFYRYLRPYVSVLGATLISGLLFAALHPQGLSAIPAILALASVFAVLREWRGSIVASMTAHALHNGLLLTIALNVVR